MPEVCHENSVSESTNRMITGQNTYTLMTGSAVRRGARQSIPSSSMNK